MSMTKNKSGWISLISVIAALLLCIGIIKTDVYAASDPELVSINGSGTQTFELSTALKGKTYSVELDNNTNVTMKVSLKYHDTKGWTTIKNNGTDTFMIPPHDYHMANFTIRSDFPGGTLSITSEINETNDAGGITFENAFLPQNTIGLTDSVKGYLYSSFYYDDPALHAGLRFFSFEVPKKRLMHIKMDLNHVHMALYLYKAGDTGMSDPVWWKDSRYANVETNPMLVLEPGKYVLKVSNNASTPDAGEYCITLSGREYISATGIKFTGSEKSLIFNSTDVKNGKKIKLTASTIPANSDDKINIVGCTDSVGKNTVSYTWNMSNAVPNSKVFTARTTNGLTKSLEAVCLPGKPVVTGVMISYDRVNFESVNSGYPQVTAKIYIRQGDKWVYKRKGGTGITIKGLKANTSYKFRFVNEYKGASGKIYKSYLDKTYKTAPKVKPSVKSVTATAVSTKYIEKKVYPGHWNSSWIWVDTVVTGGYYETQYKVTVKLNKPVSNALGLEINGKKVSGKGTTFTASFTERGKLKGTSRNILIYPYFNSSKQPSYGVSVKVKTTIK